jgi:hypothetical protein
MVIISAAFLPNYPTFSHARRHTICHFFSRVSRFLAQFVVAGGFTRAIDA